MLRRYHGLDYVGEIVNIWQSFYTQKNVVERLLRVRSGVFGSGDDWEIVLEDHGGCGRKGRECLPEYGLKRSLPSIGDLRVLGQTSRPDK
jgi:hypothetical protein